MKTCAICGNELTDLFAVCTGEPVCAICKVKYVGAMPTTKERIADVRLSLCLHPGEYIKQDNAAEAAMILGRKVRI